MSKKRRVIFAIVAVEILLAGILLVLAQKGIDNPSRVTPDFQRTLGETMGRAMGAFLGFGGLLLFMAAKTDRAAANARRNNDAIK